MTIRNRDFVMGILLSVAVALILAIIIFFPLPQQETYYCYDHNGLNVQNVTLDVRMEKSGYPIQMWYQLRGTPYYEISYCYRTPQVNP